jgi:hypothetical protein
MDAVLCVVCCVLCVVCCVLCVVCCVVCGVWCVVCGVLLARPADCCWLAAAGCLREQQASAAGRIKFLVFAAPPSALRSVHCTPATENGMQTRSISVGALCPAQEGARGAQGGAAGVRAHRWALVPDWGEDLRGVHSTWSAPVAGDGGHQWLGADVGPPLQGLSRRVLSVFTKSEASQGRRLNIK